MIQGVTDMWLIAFLMFFISFSVFAFIMIREPRALWSGNSFFIMMLCLTAFMVLTLSESKWLSDHEVIVAILVILLILAVLCVIAFPGLLILIFFIEGIKVIRHEGMKPSNLLSMVFSALLYGYLAVWPMVGRMQNNSVGMAVYGAVSFSAVYVLALMAMYSFSALLNLIHLRRRRNADYIVVLGAGIIGTRVTPLLGARIDKGIELLKYNPDALMIMSGGQGPGEDVAEGEAMAAYAEEKGVDRGKILVERQSGSTEENLLFSRKLMEKENPKVIVVTTAYHVLRALMLARRLGIGCVGFGAKTKWYFMLNALIREFVGYLKMTWKRHGIIIFIGAGLILVFC